MNKFKIFTPVFLCFCMLLISACNTKDFHPKAIKRVVVIGVDGMSVPGLLKGNTPNFDKFMAEGAYSLHARDILPTVSSPNWEAMLTGSNAAQTGVTSNEWRHDVYNLPPVVTTENGRYPDIFYAIKKSNPSIKTASVYDWGGFGNLYDHHFVDVDVNVEKGGAKETTQKVVDVLKNEKPDFLFIQLDNVDHAGHADGHMSPSYISAVELADSLAGVITNAAKEAGTFDETMFLVIADHGFNGHNHGDQTIQGNEVPFILYGNGLKKGYQIPAAVNVTDVAATVACIFNVTAPQVWIGRPVICAFEGAPEPDPKSLMGQFLTTYNCTPAIYPVDSEGKSGGLFVNKTAIVTMKTEGKDGKICYTTDGSVPTKDDEVYIKPFELDHTATVRAAFFANDGKHSMYTEGFFRVYNNDAENMGINYKLYKGQNWTALPYFGFLKPVESGRVFEISSEQLAGKLGEYTGVVFDGFISLKNDGEYTFSTRSDDGSKLFIDEKEVVNNDGDHGTIEKQSSINLKAGKHKIKVAYFNGGGGGFLDVLMSGPDMARQVISPEYLSIK